MARLPQPGGDQGDWGTILNEFLEVSHEADGSLKPILQSEIENLAEDLVALAPLDSPQFTGTPTGITKAHVGLGNVDNTSDDSKPISSATQAALNGKANALDADYALSVSLGNVSNTLDLSTYMRPIIIRGTLTGNISTILLPSIPSNRALTLTLILTQDSTGAHVITWPVSKAPYGVKPTLSTAPNVTDIIHLSWDGSDWWVTAGILGGM